MASAKALRAMRDLQEEAKATEYLRKRHDVDEAFIQCVLRLLKARPRCIVPRCGRIALWRSTTPGPIPRDFIACDAHANNVTGPVALPLAKEVRHLCEALGVPL